MLVLSGSRARALAGHAFALVLLLLVAVVAYRDALFARRALGDEEAYVCAARAVAAGRALSECSAYLYGPALARLGGAIIRQGGDVALFVALRGAVWLGAVVTLWSSLALTRGPFLLRLVVAALALIMWPPVQQSLALGNLSATTAALTLAALAHCERHGWRAALLLTVAIVVKPLPAAVPAVLLGTAAGAWWRARRFESSLIITALVPAALVAAFSWLEGGLPRTPPFNAAAENPITIVRVLATLGLQVPPLSVFTAVAVLGASFAARWAPRAESLAGLAVVVSLLSSPLVWCHTWLLATPLLVLAAEATWLRYRAASAGTAERSRALLNLLVVLQCCLALSVSDAFGFVAHGTPLNALFVAVPLCAPAVLLYYCASARFSRASSHGMPQPHSSRR